MLDLDLGRRGNQPQKQLCVGCLGQWLGLYLCKNMCSACFWSWLYPLTNTAMHVYHLKNLLTVKIQRWIIPVTVQMLLIICFNVKEREQSRTFTFKETVKREKPKYCAKFQKQKLSREGKIWSLRMQSRKVSTKNYGKRYCYYYIHQKMSVLNTLHKIPKLYIPATNKKHKRDQNCWITLYTASFKLLVSYVFGL